MGAEFKNSDGRLVVDRMIAVIHENRGYLSEIDGAIGDGDHGINMDKGFSLVEERLAGGQESMSEALKILGKTLVMEIGGSMGPLYGSFFRGMSRAVGDDEVIDVSTLERMINTGYEKVIEMGEAKVGDKTMVDALQPARDAVLSARAAGKDLADAVDEMIGAAETGWQSTEDMVARMGRSARLGERSRGVLDAGATSCYLLLKAMGEAMKELAQ